MALCVRALYLLTDVLLEYKLFFECLHLVLEVHPSQDLTAQLVLGVSQCSLYLVKPPHRRNCPFCSVRSSVSLLFSDSILVNTASLELRLASAFLHWATAVARSPSFFWFLSEKSIGTIMSITSICKRARSPARPSRDFRTSANSSSYSRRTLPISRLFDSSFSSS
ncbi:hypothetical protein EYF80_028106 [Liparis tanakae]|uniref:Uncharacterized protein n=1 Tax=Liparis tanakae TaxID=230148 RepID=A0A4Z2H7D1_9TELE|nr:hypothetical protein EYF80_028106 [Liparis tanakae]